MVIAHRLSTIKDADWIIVLHEGGGANLPFEVSFPRFGLLKANLWRKEPMTNCFKSRTVTTWGNSTTTWGEFGSSDFEHLFFFGNLGNRNLEIFDLLELKPFVIVH